LTEQLVHVVAINLGRIGLQTDYVYDALNRVTNRNYSTPGGTPANYQASPNVTYTYGTTAPAIGKLTKVESSVSTTEYTGFDILGRVTGAKQTTDGTDYATAYTYNLSGALIEETYPSGRVVKNTLDSNGDLAMTESKRNSAAGYWSYANSFTYNPAGAMTSMQLGNGRWEGTTFNARLQPTQIVLGTVQSATDSLKLNYDYGSTANNGNVLSQTITVPTVGVNNGFAAVQTYNYDSLNRLKDATENITPNGGSQTQSWKQTFTFDRYGNRNFDQANTTRPASFANPNVTNPTIDPSNNRFASGQGYSYDSSGNTTAVAEGRAFVYDAENKQVSVSDTGGTIGQYWYDGDGKRVKKNVPATGENTVFVYDAGGKEIAEYSTQTASQQDAKVAYLTNDHLGSPRINTDAIGAVTARHDYMPFGEELGFSQRTAGLGYEDDDIRRKYAGHSKDTETNLDFVEARMYANELGRFTSVDSVGPDLKNPQTLNKYQYGLNNPLRFVDKNGKYEEDVHRDLTELLAYAAGFSQYQSKTIAAADQDIDDNYFTSPYNSIKTNEEWHFTTQERRDDEWSQFENEATNGGQYMATKKLGQFMHSEQDSFAHRGYGPIIGHFFGGHDVDKTYLRPGLAEDMARDTFNQLVKARNVIARKDGQLYRPISYGAIKGLISQWVRESDPEKKRALGEEIRKKIQNGRDVQKDSTTPTKTVKAKTIRVRGEDE
jgi:RHS repeat-associated protein